MAHTIFPLNSVVVDVCYILLGKVPKLGEVEDPGSDRRQFWKHRSPKGRNSHHVGLNPKSTS